MPGVSLFLLLMPAVNIASPTSLLLFPMPAVDVASPASLALPGCVTELASVNVHGPAWPAPGVEEGCWGAPGEVRSPSGLPGFVVQPAARVCGLVNKTLRVLRKPLVTIKPVSCFDHSPL